MIGHNVYNLNLATFASIVYIIALRQFTCTVQYHMQCMTRQ